MTRALIALALLGCVGCGDDPKVRYVAELGFSFPMGTVASGTVIRIDVFSGDDDEMWPLRLGPDADPAEGQYSVVAEPSGETRVRLVAGENSAVGSTFRYRAWTPIAGMCCGVLCSPGFAEGEVIDSTRVDSTRIPQQVPMAACPTTVQCGVAPAMMLCPPPRAVDAGRAMDAGNGLMDAGGG